MAKSTRKAAPKSSRTKSAKKAPWSRSNPRKRAGKASKHLSPAKKSAAKARAKRAGRPYPNLVDNMALASTSKSSKSSKFKSSASKASKKAKTAKESSAKKSAKKKATARKGSAGKKASKKKSSTSKASAKKKSTRATPRKAAAARTSPVRRSSRQPAEKDPRGGLTAAGRKAFAERDGAHLKPGVTKTASQMSPAEMRRKGSWAVRFYGRAKLPALKDKQGQPTRFALSAHAWGEPVPKTEAAARRIAAKGERLLERYRQLKDKGAA
ncbi:DUF6321 domain-containing protein [Rhodopseudomonas sp. HC1]|uniref:DUF6321 domain-containing protein n=1 Tax=Rhodopseudomonas infernalis TaxID=2897386 RepID=UPI001EE7C586|nr:DUF6321 domain-containing protein [Rhodopseudomonas infernalis]MCG6204555.1 DUF6321 domain-containing protein [Rhodopseudomonas infernalis]